MARLLVVGIGGFLGAILRYAVSDRAMARLGWHSSTGTLLVNGVGCLVMGLLVGFFEARPDTHPAVRLFVGTGVLGALTTFSTFSSETLGLVQQGNTRGAFLNVAANLVVGFAGVCLGRMLVR